ncbi:uncharacterized protein VP01_3885g4 [Puccinia sorghi]|uniref:Retrotransposon gag domain-containing protein n=1 Tax=Puccinia sorghi TaxID=27349 RepID=A0A0L6UUS8_9BASI|nr:uncharacterized protein VP01_3885g4 [Puccinia sorghi]
MHEHIAMCAHLDTTTGQRNPTPASNLVLAQPQPFNGTRGAAAKAFVGQIGLHAIAYPKRFPTDASQVEFAVLFMKDYTATWCQLYLDKVFNGEPVFVNDFLKDFRSSLFDQNRRHHAECYG